MRRRPRSAGRRLNQQKRPASSRPSAFHRVPHCPVTTPRRRASASAAESSTGSPHARRGPPRIAAYAACNRHRPSTGRCRRQPAHRGSTVPRAAREACAERTAAGCQQDAIVRIGPLARVVAPRRSRPRNCRRSRNRARSIARESSRSRRTHAARTSEKPPCGRRPASTKGACEVFGNPVQHGTGRADRQHVPEEHAEHVAMRCDHGVNQRMADDFADRHVDRRCPSTRAGFRAHAARRRY